ncbi:AI-2E family transporter [Leptolyngbya sp. 15MV]|nr:AI-2E family transporter [Leptolyngbya sp. 15MV]
MPVRHGRPERSIQELYRDDPERADALAFGRRGALKGAALAAMGATLGASIPFAGRMPAGTLPALFAPTARRMLAGSALGFVLAFGVGLYATYFLLRDGARIGPAVLDHLPMERAVAERLGERFLIIVRATIKGSVVVGLVQGALGAITFWIAGVPSALLFGVLMAIASLLPAVGPALVWIPVAIYLLATGAIWQGVVVIASGVAVIGLADNLLRPILVGRDTGIPDWVILVTTLGGIAAMGLSGIVVGPLVAGLFIAGWAILREEREGRAGAGPA